MKKHLFFLIATLLLLLLVPAAVLAAQGYSIDWWTADSGGGLSQGSDYYTLQGSIGQPDTALSQGGQFALAGGFWAGCPSQPELLQIYLPMTVRH